MMNLTDIIEGIKTGWEILNKIVNFDVLWDYIKKAFEAIVAMF